MRWAGSGIGFVPSFCLPRGCASARPWGLGRSAAALAGYDWVRSSVLTSGQSLSAMLGQEPGRCDWVRFVILSFPAALSEPKGCPHHADVDAALRCARRGMGREGCADPLLVLKFYYTPKNGFVKECVLRAPKGLRGLQKRRWADRMDGADGCGCGLAGVDDLAEWGWRKRSGLVRCCLQERTLCVSRGTLFTWRRLLIDRRESTTPCPRSA